ncbi:MAG TPA: hypothetical protein VK325_10830, partial [Pseudoxanthomonas sp.]|nr:hypothetical protein [Pseudoxanthomonas sp.]
MRAMDQPSPRAADATSAQQEQFAWGRALLWSGVPPCLFGLYRHDLWRQWPSGRFGELVALSLLAMLLAWPLRHFARLTWASALGVVWLAALVPFAGALPVLAVVAIAMACAGLGSFVVRDAPLALQAACGLVLLGTLLGWGLPLPIHFRWLYLALCIGLVLWRQRALRQALAQGAACWHQAVQSEPKLAALAVIALGLASTGCWLPTLQVDDLGYHLRLPWALAAEGRYLLEADTHIWALAPWLGDVLQAVAQVMAAAESRGSLNALWVLITAAGVWALATALHCGERGAWLAVALYASLPLTAVLGASMQTETPTAALLVWLAWAIVAAAPGPRAGLAAAILVAGLLALKLAAAAFALLLLPWALWRWRRRPFRVALAALLAVGLGGSSYAYASMAAGNPFLPLFNGYFRSPFFAAFDFKDARWHAGFDAALPWNLTFDSGRYLEAYAGAGGFVLVALAGAWLIALIDRRSRSLAVMSTLLFAVPLIPTQYLRYVFPALVLLTTVLVAAAIHADRQRAGMLLVALCVLNFAFQANGHWMLRSGALKQALHSVGSDAPLFEHYAPERLLASRIRASEAPQGNVLALDPAHPTSAEFGSRGRTTSQYDFSL